jgi:hypothetical protein
MFARSSYVGTMMDTATASGRVRVVVERAIGGSRVATTCRGFIISCHQHPSRAVAGV